MSVVLAAAVYAATTWLWCALEDAWRDTYRIADEHSTLRRTGRKIAVTPAHPQAVESRCAPGRRWFRRPGAIDPQLIPAVLLAVGWPVIAVEVAW